MALWASRGRRGDLDRKASTAPPVTLDKPVHLGHMGGLDSQVSLERGGLEETRVLRVPSG